jgi:hypothetical protein
VVEFENEIEVGFEIDSEAEIEVAVDVEFQEVAWPYMRCHTHCSSDLTYET